MIRQRVRAGLSVVKAKIERDGQFTSKAGKVRRRLGRPGAETHKIEHARRELSKGAGIGKTARLTGLGVGTVHKLKRAMTADLPARTEEPRGPSGIIHITTLALPQPLGAPGSSPPATMGDACTSLTSSSTALTKPPGSAACADKRAIQ
jgi:hypothetical protein